jgi:hypothetical protein
MGQGTGKSAASALWLSRFPVLAFEGDIAEHRDRRQRPQVAARIETTRAASIGDLHLERSLPAQMGVVRKG